MAMVAPTLRSKKDPADLRKAPPVKRILDLGCGSGRWPQRLGTRPDDAAFIGVDISHDACVRASQKNKELCWTCVCARGEQLPLGDASMDFVTSTVALPYMNIPTALSEIRRVLKPGGSLDVSLHTFSFTLADLRKNSTLNPSKLLYRLYVFANGFWFHLTGNVMRSPFSSRVESWQSQRGMKIALQRAGFASIHYAYLSNGRFCVQALHPAPPARNVAGSIAL
jgi:ubiquinone/menaquinone biosynthesis C-methylase UbiE